MGARLGTVLVVGLVLTAGCSALPLGDDASGQPTPTLTPVPFTDTATTQTATPYPSAPPGVGPDGTLNVTELQGAHERFLENRTYRWRFRYTVSDGGERLYGQDISRRAVVGPDAFLITQESPGPAVNQSLYVAGGRGYLRTTSGDDEQFDLLTDPQSHHEYAFAGTTMHRFLGGLDFVVRVVERDGSRLYRLHTSGTEAPEALRATGSNVWNYTVTAYVTPAGFVRALAVDYDRSQGSQVQDVTVRFSYYDVDATTVFRPTWVSNVLTPAPPTPANATGTAENETVTAAPGSETTPPSPPTATLSVSEFEARPAVGS